MTNSIFIKYGLVTLPGTVKELHRKWVPPDYVFEFWQTGAKVPYIDHEDYIKKKEEVLESYRRLT